MDKRRIGQIMGIKKEKRKRAKLSLTACEPLVLPSFVWLQLCTHYSSNTLTHTIFPYYTPYYLSSTISLALSHLRADMHFKKQMTWKSACESSHFFTHTLWDTYTHTHTRTYKHKHTHTKIHTHWVQWKTSSWKLANRNDSALKKKELFSSSLDACPTERTLLRANQRRRGKEKTSFLRLSIIFLKRSLSLKRSSFVFLFHL